MESVDERKQFILTTAGRCFGFNDEALQKYSSSVISEKSLDEFLDGFSCFILSVKRITEFKLLFNNTVTAGDGDKLMVVFFKVRPEVVTPNNLHDIVFFCSMIDSPIISFYHSVQRIYAPALLKNDEISQNIQSLVSDLETNLKSAVLRNTADDSTDSGLSTLAVLCTDDELQFWKNVISVGKRKSDKEKAKAFIEILEPFNITMRELESRTLAELDETVELAHNAIDDLWKIDEYRFPQTRMEHLMDVIGNSFVAFIQCKLKLFDLWNGAYIDVQEAMNQSITACDKWCLMCQRLTSLFWPHHSLHQWSGGPYSNEYLNKFSNRLKEILKVRTISRQLTRLLTATEQEELNTKDFFTSFKDLSPFLVNQYTEPFWQTAVKQFENKVQPAEERVAAKLKTQLRGLDTNTLQLVQELNRYQDLIERPVLRQFLIAEREVLLGLLQDYISGITIDGGSIKLVDMPPVVCSLYWVHQQEVKMSEIEKMGERLLGDLSGWKELHHSIQSVRSELKQYHSELFDSWTRDTTALISERTLGLDTEEPVVRFEQGKLMRVNYDPRLVKLVKEVRQLSVLGYSIPPIIVDTAHLAKGFIKQARELQQVATFHNTIGDRMITSQRPMMLAAAVELARLVREQHNVTWCDTAAVDLYIERLQAAVSRLYRENNKLAAYHDQILQHVITLMETDLLRQQYKWKDGLHHIRDIISLVEEQFSNMKSWCVHWDYQLYKALEHQYQIGLEAINEHLPEIKVELVYRQQKLQFSPPMEEIRMKYYRQLKHFMSIPLNFRGVSDGKIFPSIIERNAHRFGRVFERAEQLFSKLTALSNEWIDRVALGNVDWDILVEQHLVDAQDWDLNFRASKSWGQQIAKLSGSEHKVGCFTVSVSPVRAEIEMHNRKYWDILASSLHSSVIQDVTKLEKFVSDSRNSLEQAPQSLTEVGDANNRHQAIAKAADQMVDLIDCAIKKNKTLASWTKERVEHVSHMTVMWDNLQSLLNNQQLLIAKQVETMKNNLVSEAERISEDIERFALHWAQLRPREDNLAVVTSNSDSGQNIVHLLKEKRQQWNNLVESTQKIRDDFIQFGMDPPEFTKCNEVEQDLNHHEEIWAVYEQFMSGLNDMGKEEWIVLRSRCQVKFDNFLSDWTTRLTDEGKPVTTMSAYLLQEIERYKDMLPVIKFVRGEMFSDKHWMELFGILQTPYKPIEQLLFSDLLPLRDTIIANCSALQDLNNRAAGEVVIRQALSDLDIWEVEAKFSLISHIDSRGNTVYLIKDFTDVMNKVGDNQCLLQSVKSSPNYENFIDRTSIWEKRLTDLDNFLRMLHQVQRKWVYLEPIFGASTLNVEKSRFDRVDRDVRFILNEISSSDQRVVGLCRIPNLNHILPSLCQHLSHCQKNLLDFLEEKRNKFPRFYFLGDDDLLEILGQSQKQEVILSHLKKLFTGIHSVEFKGGSIVGMCSVHGEIVPLSKPVPVTTNVEEWLSSLAEEMKVTLQVLVLDCLRVQSPDPLVYPSQVLCLAERVSFTTRCEDAIRSGKLPQLLSSLHAQLEEYTKQQNEWKGGNTDDQRDNSLDNSTVVLQLKLKALLMDTIYHKNVVSELVRSNVSSLDDWEWQRRLRFYSSSNQQKGKGTKKVLGARQSSSELSSDNTVIVKMVDVEFEYSYEYQGNADKLVHTPLTDKCYLTLTQAMSVGLGGNPYGPAGTGKTESVKALAALLGRQVLVFNCDEGIDVQSLTRILMGLVKCGAWGCFDEFNRLEEATLSAISMQIHKIQEALRTNAINVELLDQQVLVDNKTGLFVTLNPAGQGYGGRQQLPDNLKQLFRPVAMSQPDEKLIAEVILHCEGFLYASEIAHKLVTLFAMARKLLSQQQHYDWGLRALKTVIGGCGTAIRQARLKGDKNEEMSLVVRIVRLNILSKLTFSDCYCFDELLKDTFPAVQFEASGHSHLVKAIQDAYNELGLVHSHRQERKCIELYEQLIQRMGVVVVGSAGSGKTTVMRLLKLALMKLGAVVKQNVINPKSMSRTQLLGQTDPDTRQWTDGVLSSIAQSVYNQPPDIQSWILFDGDIDPEWVESLNSVLDDNRLLTLPSGWRIQFGPNVHFLFETHDLKHASPATVSRMGVILISEEEFDTKHVIEAWLLKQLEEEAEILSRFIEDYFYRGLSWVMEQGDLALQTSRVGIISNGLSLLSGCTTIARFTFNLAAGLGSLLKAHSRELLYKQLFEWTGELLPDGIGQQLQWSCYDKRRDCIEDFVYNNDSINNKECINPYALIITGRIQSAASTLLSWLCFQNPFILYGPSGSGKSLLLDHCLKLLQSQSNMHLHLQVATIYCSAHITPQHVLQKLSQLCLVVSSSTGRVYKPKNGQHLILHLKDINLVRPDKWGTSMLITFVQQLLMYGAFYDNNLEWVALENVQIITSVSSMENLGSRFISLNKIYYLSSPEKGELRNIFGAYMNALLIDNKKSSSSLASAMVNIYQEIRNSLQSGLQSHYVFTPRDITRWCIGLMRYPLHDNQCTIEALLYEALRLFKDKLVCDIDKLKLQNILTSILDADSQWMSVHNSQAVDSTVGLLTDVFYVTEVSSSNTGNSYNKICGPSLIRLNESEWSSLVQKEIVRLGLNDTIVLLPELYTLVAVVERVLSCPGQSLVLAGRPGSGRKTAVRVVASRQSANIFTLKIGHAYSLNNFKNDLKKVMQLAGLEGEQVYFILEDYQIISSEFLDMLNSLLSSGEVPGLYQLEELDNLTAAINDLADQNNFYGTSSQFFAKRVQDNLHVIFCFDYNNSRFKQYLTSNPAILKRCCLIWLDKWCRQSMKMIPQVFISREANKNVPDSLLDKFLIIYENTQYNKNKDDIAVFNSSNKSSPRQYFALITTFLRVMLNYENSIKERQTSLEAGVSKLNEARNVVSTLKLEAAEQEKLLAEKQEKATTALEMITETMSNANVHRNQMEELKKRTEQENEMLMIRKEEIDAELAEIEPLIQEACAAVGNIKSESLSEIRSLRAPPDVIRDILEGVLRLMGTQDTSWNSMKTFLAKRGVKEDIRCFDAHKISPENRESVEQLLSERKESFVAKTAKRASVAAAPLAAWVTANVRYSKVLEKIRPLEKEQAKLQRNLKLAEEKIEQLSSGLDDVDQTVGELKMRLNTFTREAAEIEIHLNNAQDTIAAAEGLVSKLDDEFYRWQHQLQELSDDFTKLPLNSLVAAAFVIYLASSPQDLRSYSIEKWCELVGLDRFDLFKFLSKEQELIKWQCEGLPSDKHSVENAIIILKAELCPLLIDPSSQATEWLIKHFKQQPSENNDSNNRMVEVITQSSNRFQTILELAIRFGKVLIICEVTSIDPVLYPVLRHDFTYQGPRKMMQVGEKLIDYNSDFKLFLISRSDDIQISPDALALICKVNFTTSPAGLTQQLLGCALKEECPELENRRTQLLHQEEQLRIELHSLQEAVLCQLASADGNILQNKELLSSLNETKRSSEQISRSLKESEQLQHELNQECNVYQPLAEYASRLYFSVISLQHINNMYCLSSSAFTRLYVNSLKSTSGEGNDNDSRCRSFLHLIYFHISRSIFKADRLMFALHLVHELSPQIFQANEWQLFTGQAAADISESSSHIDSSRITETVPAWLEQDRVSDVFQLKSVLPDFYSKLDLDNGKIWKGFPRNNKTAPVPVSLFQYVLLVQALAPDCLHSAVSTFAMKALGLETLSAPPLSLLQLLDETFPNEPVLLISAQGTDPSIELRDLASAKLSSDQGCHEVSLGQGQEKAAIDFVYSAASDGSWVILKNLHLMIKWLPTLESELRHLTPHPTFRLWMTTQQHSEFPSTLASTCLKLTYESPQGVKRNMQHTYSSWEKLDKIHRPFFCLAWFHALVSERRMFIPQGWTKYYEFNETDIAAATSSLYTIIALSGGRDDNIRWEYLRGLCESAIYGGRIDNSYDLRVLTTYLKLMFSSSILKNNGQISPGVNIPSTDKKHEHLKIINKLPDQDDPIWFGLPENVDRSWQRNTCSFIINQLKVISIQSNSNTYQEKASLQYPHDWHSYLQDRIGPLLNIWKKLNQGVPLIKQKPSVVICKNVDPISGFITREYQFAITLIQVIHSGLASITRLMRTSVNTTSSSISTDSSLESLLIQPLVKQQTPEEWLKVWDGPSDPAAYLRSVMSRGVAINTLHLQQQEKLSLSSIDLADIFHPVTLLNALCQATAREKNVSIGDLILKCTWDAPLPHQDAHSNMNQGTKLTVVGLQLEGATFNSHSKSLSPNAVDSPDVSIAPPIVLTWTTKITDEESSKHSSSLIMIPLYSAADRKNVVAELTLPCKVNEQPVWMLAGTAFYIRS